MAVLERIRDTCSDLDSPDAPSTTEVIDPVEYAEALIAKRLSPEAVAEIIIDDIERHKVSNQVGTLAAQLVGI